MSIIMGGKEIERVVYNGKELETVYYNGVEVFTSARQVLYELINLVKISCPDKVKSGGTLVATIGGASGYLTPETITVTMDGVALTKTETAASYYTYDANIGEIKVYNCTGVIKISATSDLKYSTLWEFSSYTVTKYNGNDLNVTIPYCYKSYKRDNKTYFITAEKSTSGYTNVTTIGDSIFYGKSTLRNVTVYAPVKTINSEAFRGCSNLQTFSAPSSLTTIGRNAFYGCTSLTRGASATTISGYAYYNCTSLMTLDDKYSSFTFSTVDEYAFYNCSSLNITDISFYKVGMYAFWNCNNIRGKATLSTKVSSGTYSIGSFAFAKTNISTFDIYKIEGSATLDFQMGCFSSNSNWTINGSGYYVAGCIVRTSTSSSDAGTYKYVYGGHKTYSQGTVVSGDYVPSVYVGYAWNGIESCNTMVDNITSLYSGSYFTITASDKDPAGWQVYGLVKNASSSTSTFKSAYARIRYKTINNDPNNLFGSQDWTEVEKLTPIQGIPYFWYPFYYVTAQSSGCVAFDTPITLADGTTKKVQDVTFKDRILRFNHDTGKIDTSYCHWINKEEIAQKYWLVKFSDGSEIKFIFPHAMFSLDEMCYVQVMDAERFKVGTRVSKQIMVDGKFELTEVKVTSIEQIFEEIHYCEVVTGQFYNCFANNLLISEPFTIGFQNMYGFNDDMTYKSPVRKQYLRGEYKGYLFSEEYIRDTLRITDKDSLGFRAEEWGMLMEQGLIDEPNIHDMIDNFVNSDLHKLETIKDDNGVNLWPVTTDIDDVVNIDDYMHKELDEYVLPTCDKENFKGWYCSADSKVYKPGDIYKVRYGTHFTAICE